MEGWGNRKIIAVVMCLMLSITWLPKEVFAQDATENKTTNWKVQNYMQSGDVEAPEGLISITPNKGFVVHTKVNNGNSVIIYDENQEEYTDSILEFDLNISGEYEKFYRVGILPRFKAGNNCGGLSIDKQNQFMEIGSVQTGREYWNGIANLSDFSFQPGHTYSLKVITEGSEMKMYVIENGVEKLVMKRGTNQMPASGNYAFRIWGGDKAAALNKEVKIDHINFQKICNSKFLKTNAEIEESLWGLEDKLIKAEICSQDNITGISNGNEILVSGVDYIIDEKGIIIKKEYLSKQVDTFVLKVSFQREHESIITVNKIKPYKKTNYIQTFEGDISNWKQVGGTGRFNQVEGGLHIQGKTVLIDELSPTLKDFEAEYTLEELNDNGGIGFVFRALDKEYISVYNSESAKENYATSIWQLDSNGAIKQLHTDGTPLLKRNGVNHKFKIRLHNQELTMWLDNQVMMTKKIENISNNGGHIGFRTQGNTNVILKKVVYSDYIRLPKEQTENGQVHAITNGDFTVQLANEFPRVIKYILNNKQLNGCEIPKNYVSINTIDYKATAKIIQETEQSIIYNVKVEDINVAFDVIYKVLDDNILDIRIKNIEDAEHIVYSLGFPDQPIISANNSEGNVRLAASNGEHDEFLNLETETVEIRKHTSIPIITTEELSASMANNVFNNLQEFVYSSFEDEGKISTGFWNEDFLYRGIDGKKLIGEDEGLSCQVAVTEDTNGDGQLNWQDGANALKKIIRGKIKGAEKVRNSYIHVGYNFASGVQQPFLKVGDNLKRLSNLLDGFGQILVFKGYANEGHDSGHADYDNINVRAGGAKDMNVLTNVADGIDATVGVHINHSEAYPEAKMYTDEVMSTKNGWFWLDDAKYIRREVDIMSQGMNGRINNMFRTVPGIGFTYVDTYRDDRWASARLAQAIVDDNESILGTEEGKKLDRWTAWAHAPEFKDGIHRFVYNQYKDVYKGSNIYRGGYMRHGDNGFMSWQHVNNINGPVKQFFTQQLPQKYLMHYDVRKIENNVAIFEKDVRSENSNGRNKIYKNGNLIADGELIFIPWFDNKNSIKDPDQADKIYHWNPNNGNTTWKLPESWSGQTNVKLYKTTQTGKVFIRNIEVENQGITINANARTPYVIYKGNQVIEEDKTIWSTGSKIEDTSFNSRDFSIWQKASSNGNTDHITIEDDHEGIATVNIKGSNDGNVHQTMKDLVPGQKYRVSVWASARNGKRARLTVKTSGKEYANYVSNVEKRNCIIDVYAYGKYFDRMWVDFVATDETADITLSADTSSEDGLVQFMETRIVETDAPELSKNVVVVEDFENVDQAYGIFVPANRNENSHLSQKHEGYTTDTINGEWSFKMATTFTTIPATLRLKPNTEYEIQFRSIGPGSISVERKNGRNACLANTRFETGKHTYKVTTGQYEDYVVRLNESQWGPRNRGTIVIDDFKVTQAETPPQRLNLEFAQDTSQGVKAGDVIEFTITPENTNIQIDDSSIQYEVSDESLISIDKINKTISVLKMPESSQEVMIKAYAVVGNDKFETAETMIKVLSKVESHYKNLAITDVDWVINENNELVSPVTGHDQVIIRKDMTLTEGMIEADILRGENTAQNQGFVISWGNDKSIPAKTGGYQIIIDQTKVKIAKSGTGDLITSDYEAEEGAWVNLKTEFNDGLIKVYVNGELKIEYTDVEMKNHYVGLYTTLYPYDANSTLPRFKNIYFGPMVKSNTVILDAIEDNQESKVAPITSTSGSAINFKVKTTK